MHLLETRVRQLILQGRALREQLRVLEDQLAERDRQIKEFECRNEQLESQYANLKIARTLELSDSDTRKARQRLSYLVRDVDKCIALLKSS